ncbi:arsenite methyltransferase [Candidatus Aerophobetes bacterium]|uniref:Arsenite methyltransferase n=1 Tax=Aerophobetes bacterium TaxID=2030807 RepID=A0A523VXZ5_UNCAE|nr:MAG: arsenite methyltransferase [Candidatus Aerophobetes bacterium]
MEDSKIRKVVREGYSKVAREANSCCSASTASCCAPASSAENISTKIGYSQEELKRVPEGANLGLGCGNPIALASLKEDETVLDLGSGAGLDCFLAVKKVGAKGKVIGVDMTPEMIDKARDNAQKEGYENVEFRLGEIENLPVSNESVDIVISNCVINLSPDKRRVFDETFRVLRSGGRLMVSDIVLLKELPDFIKNSPQAYVGCISGAMMKDEYLGAIKAAGFQEVRIVGETSFPLECVTDSAVAKEAIEDAGLSRDELKDAVDLIASIQVYAEKPSNGI